MITDKSTVTILRAFPHIFSSKIFIASFYNIMKIAQVCSYKYNWENKSTFMLCLVVIHGIILTLIQIMS